ncbi:hypothetical protein LTR36_004812 [Oleoguttula mirabilis]|uniref:Uncharacterized protein n=1 Tax=Oleoguttula mirabilis TaxID=1507867 RepID=A0AAV9JEV1_9PEZI|nr:hypothetical protein LTR36_004812 [Oleoguttula mirabilis]
MNQALDDLVAQALINALPQEDLTANQQQAQQMPPQPVDIPGLPPAVLNEIARRHSTRAGAFQRRDDPYRNTSLQELPRFGYTPGTVLDDAADTSDDDSVAAEEDIEFFDLSHIGEARQTAPDRETMAVNSKGDELNLYYHREEPERQAFRIALAQFEQQHPDRFTKFEHHMQNAHVISEAEVRTYDIIAWASSSLPAFAQKPLKELQQYYHKEIRLRYELAVLERRQHDGIDRLSADQQYAAMRSGKAYYGYETVDRARDIRDFEVRFEGRLALKHMLAELEVRLVRLEFATVKERQGNHAWVDAACLDRKVMVWIEAAESHLGRCFAVVGRSIFAGSLLASTASTEAAPLVHLAAPEDVAAYDAVKSAIELAKAKLTKRKKLVNAVINLRRWHTQKLSEFEQAVENDGGTIVSAGTAQLDEEAKSLALSVDAAEERLTQEVGEGWEWAEPQGG